MPNAEVDEAEIAKLVSDGGLKPETLARRKRVRAASQAYGIATGVNQMKTTQNQLNVSKQNLLLKCNCVKLCQCTPKNSNC